MKAFITLIILLLALALISNEVLWARHMLLTGLLGVTMFLFPITNGKLKSITLLLLLTICFFGSWAFHQNGELWLHKIGVFLHSSYIAAVSTYLSVLLLGLIAIKK
jgi:hypothetical protein